jgi:hypothetical protein
MATSESSKPRQRPARTKRWSREAAVFVWALLLIAAVGATLFWLN